MFRNVDLNPQNKFLIRAIHQFTNRYTEPINNKCCNISGKCCIRLFTIDTLFIFNKFIRSSGLNLGWGSDGPVLPLESIFLKGGRIIFVDYFFFFFFGNFGTVLLLTICIYQYITPTYMYNIQNRKIEMGSVVR